MILGWTWRDGAACAGWWFRLEAVWTCGLGGFADSYVVNARRDYGKPCCGGSACRRELVITVVANSTDVGRAEFENRGADGGLA